MSQISHNAKLFTVKFIRVYFRGTPPPCLLAVIYFLFKRLKFIKMFFYGLPFRSQCCVQGHQGNFRQKHFVPAASSRLSGGVASENNGGRGGCAAAPFESEVGATSGCGSNRRAGKHGCPPQTRVTVSHFQG